MEPVRPKCYFEPVEAKEQRLATLRATVRALERECQALWLEVYHAQHPQPLHGRGCCASTGLRVVRQSSAASCCPTAA